MTFVKMHWEKIITHLLLLLKIFTQYALLKRAVLRIIGSCNHRAKKNKESYWQQFTRTLCTSHGLSPNQLASLVTLCADVS